MLLLCFLLSFKSFRPSVPEEKRKIDFQDGGHLGFPIGMILAFLDLQVTPMLPTKFQVNWTFDSEEERKNRFSRWRPGCHFGFPIGTILTIFDLQVTPMLPTGFQVNWSFGSGEEAKNRFSGWLPWNNFNYFDL